MPAQTLVRRVVSLEGRVNSLEGLPQRIGALESQILQLREEMHSEFSSVRAEIKAGDEETQHLMRVLHEDVITRLTIIQEGKM